MRRRVIPLLIVLAILLTACSSTGSSTGKSSLPPDLKYLLEIPEESINISPAIEGGSSVESIIPPSGGELSATGKDGTVFTLRIPSRALVSDTLIRMIPVTQIEGMPFGQNPLAVQLEPEGLQFYDWVTLEITPPAEIPLDQQLLFTYQANGEDLVLAMPVVDSREIKIQLDHFSGYGVTKGLLADLEPVRARIGGTAERRINSKAAEILSKERQRQLLGGEASESVYTDELATLFTEYEEQVIKPRVAAVSESCAAGRLAIQTVLSYERQRQLLGIESNENLSSIVDLMPTVSVTCMKEEYEICRDQHIVHRIIPAWLGMERQSQLLGLEINPNEAQLLGYVQKCLSFQLAFHSEANVDFGGSSGYVSTVDSIIDITFSPEELRIKGEAPLDNVYFNFREADCNVTSEAGGAQFFVSGLGFISDAHSDADLVGYVKDINLAYLPGNTTEKVTVNCPDSPSFTLPPAPLWTGVYLVTHENELNMIVGGFEMKEWEVFGESYFAKKEWILDGSEPGVTEAGTMKLYHTPQ